MIGKYKPFSQELYDECDGPAKEAVRNHLETFGYKVIVPPENYGADLYSYQQSIKLNHEVEVSKQWKTGEFPFLTASVPERKERLLKMVSGPLFFWMFCYDMSRAVVTPGAQLISRWLVHVPNRCVKSGEYFYRVPLEFCKLLKMLGGVYV